MLPQGTESPGKGAVVSEDFIAQAIDTSPNKGSVASDALSIAESVDLLAHDPVVVSSDSEWDYDEHPLTQVSLKRSFAEARESYCAAPWAAPATPAHSPVNHDLSNTPQPFKKMRRSGFLLGLFLARTSATSVLGKFLFCGHCVVVTTFNAMLAMPLFMRNASTALL